MVVSAVEIVKQELENNGYKILLETEMKNGLGVTLKTTSGAIINIYNTGSISVQGKEPSVQEVKRALKIVRD